MHEEEYHALAALEESHWWYHSLRHRVLERLRKEALKRGRPLEVFDAGCGTGGLLRALQRQAWIVAATGCDASPIALDYCRRLGLQVSEGSVNDLVPRGPGYDAVLSMDVLYHRTVRPAAAIAGMGTLLRPGGVLLLNVAAMPCLARRHDVRVMGARRFLPAHLRALVARSGLELEELDYWNTWLTPLLWLQVRLERLRPASSSPAAPGPSLTQPPHWLNELLGRVLALEESSSSWLPHPWGSSLLLQARKPFATADE
jgi:SAM-dependent methyltransferase